MSPEEFVRAIWPDTGLYALALPFTPPDSTRAVFKHQVFASKGAALTAAQALAPTHDVYFCVNSLRERRVWNPSKPNRKTGEVGAWEVRTHQNIHAARSLFLDLDVGADGHKYPTQADALRALREFVIAVGLPTPIIVSSGYGLHVYWPLEQDVTPDQWRAVAKKLKAATVAKGLKADPSRTTDMASVLRLPGTLNHKREPRPVQIIKAGRPISLEVLQELLADFGEPTFLGGTAPATPFGENTLNHSAPPPNMKALITSCAQVRYAITHAQTLPEPLWYAMLGLVRHSKQGAAAAHKISAKHPDYTPEGTDSKLYYLESKGIGPTTCEKLDSLNPGVCGTCPRRATAKSPLVIARKTDELPLPVVVTPVPRSAQAVQPTLPNAPFPYKRTPSGVFIETVTKSQDDGPDLVETVALLAHDFFPVKRYKDTRKLTEAHVWVAVLPIVGQVEMIVPADAMYDARKLGGILANNGIFATPSLVKQVGNYMVAYIKQLQATAPPDTLRTALGWNDDHTEFTLPTHILKDDGTHVPVTLDHVATASLAAVHKAGDANRQIELLEFFNHDAYLPNQYAICAALASPLFYMTGHHGVVINMSGNPGASKSTTLYTGAGLWGHPVKMTINGTTRGATANARDNRILALSNLPVPVDEITQMAPKDAAELAMGITQAEGRLRLDATGAERRQIQGNKATIMLCTANTSLYNLLAVARADSVAEAVRVIEIGFTPQKVHTKAEADDYLEELKQNYGHIGERFMEYVIVHRAEVHTQVREMMRAIDAKVAIQPSERFWSAAAAVVLVACEIAGKLGLLKYNKYRLWEWIANTQIPAMRGQIQTQYSTPVTVLADYLDSINGNMLVLQNADTSGANNRWKSNLPTIIRQPTNAQLLARHELDRKVIWVSRKSFRDYCTKIGHNYTLIMASLAATRVIAPKPVQKVLGAGTDYAKGQTTCIVIDMAHPDVAGEAEASLKVVPIQPEVANG